MSKIKANTIENVAGTESHSVDTMGIESGSDANGSYTKFPDGTLIQRGDDTISFNGGTNSETLIITLPMSFIDVDYQCNSIADRDITEAIGLMVCYASGRNRTTASFETNFVTNDNSTVTGDISFQWTAIGKWK